MWDDSGGTEGEEIPRPRKDSCCELVMDIISVKAGGEGGSHGDADWPRSSLLCGMSQVLYTRRSIYSSQRLFKVIALCCQGKT